MATCYNRNTTEYKALLTEYKSSYTVDSIITDFQRMNKSESIPSLSEAKINKFENDKRDAFAFEIPEAVEELEVEEAPIEETENIEDIEIDVDEETNTVERLMNLQNQSNDILDELELTKDAIIESWYDSLTNEEQQKVGSKDEIMEAYLSYPIDANEFIENLKKCYLK